MINLKKLKTEFGYSFDFITDDGVFKIYFWGDLDLHWEYHYKDDISKIGDSKSFLITKEKFFLFQLFDDLYHDIKDYHIYKEDEFYTKQDVERFNKSIMKFDAYPYDLLFHDDKIEWHCDDCIYEEASMFMIEKLDEAYLLTFKKGIKDGMLSYSVRIRNSGSRYHPFNIPFMRMYQQLCSYDFERDADFHQIHMEEYLYQKKRIKKKEII